ncbi:sigma factor-like helix-turn-helix DNA-binding protein, partial [Cloacibacillus evryensis]
MYREILRLHFEGGLSQRDIAASCRCAHSTVKRILARAAELELD